MTIKKTKIVCTIGPATESEVMLEKLLKAGMNVARLNFSHGDFAEHQNKVDNLKKAVEKTGIPCAVLQDLSGPKFRLGDFYQERVQLKAGDMITLTTEKIMGDEKRVSVNYPTLHQEILPGNIIMVDDGKKKFEVISVEGTEIHCKILVGGDTKGRRSLNLPGAPLKISSLTDKDKIDIEFGIRNDVDIVAFSFVRYPSDVVELREILNAKKSKAKIMAKIETVEAIENFDEILHLVDMVMVARGDLAVEYGHENVPHVQKMMISKCVAVGKPVVTATQMLESMIKNPVPTRAEVSDVANAIYDGTDAVMLSEETTLGDYPIEAVEMISKIAKKTEKDYPEKEIFHSNSKSISITDSITGSVVKTSHDIKAKAIIAMTQTGFTARMISRHRPKSPIFALSSDPKTVNQLCVSFGCVPILIEEWKSITEAFAIVRKVCLENKVARSGDHVVIAAGAPNSVPTEYSSPLSNMIMVETI